MYTCFFYFGHFTSKDKKYFRQPQKELKIHYYQKAGAQTGVHKGSNYQQPQKVNEIEQLQEKMEKITTDHMKLKYTDHFHLRGEQLQLGMSDSNQTSLSVSGNTCSMLTSLKKYIINYFSYLSS